MSNHTTRLLVATLVLFVVSVVAIRALMALDAATWVILVGVAAATLAVFQVALGRTDR